MKNKTPVKVLNIKGKEKDKGFVNIFIYIDIQMRVPITFMS